MLTTKKRIKKVQQHKIYYRLYEKDAPYNTLCHDMHSSNMPNCMVKILNRSGSGEISTKRPLQVHLVIKESIGKGPHVREITAEHVWNQNPLKAKSAYTKSLEI